MKLRPSASSALADRSTLDPRKGPFSSLESTSPTPPSLVRIKRLQHRHESLLEDLGPQERQLVILLALTLLLLVEGRTDSAKDDSTVSQQAMLDLRAAMNAPQPVIELVSLAARKPQGVAALLARELLEEIAYGLPLSVCHGATWVAAAELGTMARRDRLRNERLQAHCGRLGDRNRA